MNQGRIARIKSAAAEIPPTAAERVVKPFASIQHFPGMKKFQMLSIGSQRM